MTESQPSAQSRPRVAAGALFFDETGRVLLVKPSYKPGWEIPGGCADPGESPLATCVREVSEELGIRPPIGALLAVDWAPGRDADGKLVFIFDGGVLAPALRARIALQAEELTEYAFATTADVPALLPGERAGRVAAAIAAHAGGGAAYLHQGGPPTGSRTGSAATPHPAGRGAPA